VVFFYIILFFNNIGFIFHKRYGSLYRITLLRNNSIVHSGTIIAMEQETKKRITKILTEGLNVPLVETLESRYPARKISGSAEITRFCPSPTGFVHIGAIFTALACQYIAKQSGGKYIMRIEDTDKKREVEGAKELISQQLAVFGLAPDEGLQADGTTKGDYGPYVQSERREIYLAYALDLLKKGRAYPCFASPEELQNAIKDQQTKKIRPGYYGEWALWRDRSDADINKALDFNQKFVLRFKSQGSHTKRIEFDDVLKDT
jgi:glutamyl-tRNA synthetase